MPPNKSTKDNDFPFITRKMLDFEHAARFSLRITTQAFTEAEVIISGITKAGAFQYKYTALSSGAQETRTYALSDIPIWVSISESSGTVLQGQLYANVNLLLDGNVINVLCSGFVAGNGGISWPTTNLLKVTAEAGQPIVIDTTNPAAGSEISYTVPDYTILKVRSLSVTLVTDANAANRTVTITVGNGAGVYIKFICATVQVANATINYSITQTTPGNAVTDGTTFIIALPEDFTLYPGFILQTETINKQAGDNYGVMRIVADRYPYPTALL